MRKNFGVKPVLYPMPVLILGTYDADGTPDAMNAAWGGISEENEISICISADHKTTLNLLETGAFTVSIPAVENVVAADYVGIVSGNEVPDKVARAGWHAQKSALVNAPLFEELALALECHVKSYDPDTCRLVGEILNVSADERILGADGKVDLTKFRPITYDPMGHTYRVVGESVGHAFRDGLALK